MNTIRIKKTLIQTLVFLLAGPSLVTAVEMTDYTITDSKYQEAYLRGNFDTKSGNQDQTSFSYSVTGDYETYFSTLLRTWRLTLDGTASGSRGANNTDITEEQAIADMAAVVDNYFTDDNKFFWFGSTDVNYDSEASDSYPTKTDANDLKIHVGGGVGFGRIFIATPLAKALRVIDELSEKKLTASPVSDKTYLEIAQVVDRQAEYRSKYGDEEYKSQWYADIEKILVRDGLLKEGRLGAGAALDMDRVLVDELFSARKHGWLVRAGLGLLLQDYSGETDNDPTFDAVFEYAKPFGYKGQFDNILSYQTVFASDTDQYFRNEMSYTLEVSDRIDWVNNWDIELFVPGDSALDDTVTNNLSTGFDYYLTNQVTCGILATATHVNDGVDDNDSLTDVNNDDIELTTAFSIKYRFL